MTCSLYKHIGRSDFMPVGAENICLMIYVLLCTLVSGAGQSALPADVECDLKFSHRSKIKERPFSNFNFSLKVIQIAFVMAFVRFQRLVILSP